MACGEQSAGTEVLTLRVHSLPRCQLPSGLERGSLELLALGDFAASNASADVLGLDQRGEALPFPAATRAATASVAGSDASFWGYGERRDAGVLDLLLWPTAATCKLSRAGAGHPGKHGGQALGYAPDLGLVLAVGGNQPLSSDAIVGVTSFNVARGEAATLVSGGGGVLQQPRAFASITRFGDAFLVAGGEQPVAGVPELDLEPQGTAELFYPQLGGFSGEPLRLLSTRTHHAAITLEDGRSLLAGGRTAVNGFSIAQYQLEIVDPGRRTASVGDAVAARIDPQILRLSDGRLLVAGGVTLEGSPAEPAAQWLDRAGRLERTRVGLDVAPRFQRAFVAALGGGVLAVGGCEDRPAASEEDGANCAARCGPGHGCPPLGGYDAWWIDRNGEASAVAMEGIVAPQPILLPGSDGSPWLIAADEGAPEEPRLFRFNPWAERFEPSDVAPGLRLPRPGFPQPLAIDPDTFVWLDDEGAAGALLGVRLGTRNRYEQDLALVLLSDPTDPSRPLHLVPSGPRDERIRYDGALTLVGDDTGHAPTVELADVDFADVTLRVHVRGASLPQLVLGKTTLGGTACPWPSGASATSQTDLAVASVLRSGERAELRYQGAVRTCQVEPGRLTLALRAGGRSSTVTQLDVERGTPQR